MIPVAPLLGLFSPGALPEASRVFGEQTGRGPHALSRVLYRAKERGCINLYMADEITCVLFGKHPVEVW